MASAAAAEGSGGDGGVRVRLSFEEENCPRSSSSLRTSWFLVRGERRRQRTIDELSDEIQRRFDCVRCGGLQLYIDGCLLPPWESVAILRENDLISVFKVPKGSEVEKKSNRNEVNDGKFTEDELLVNAGTDGRRKRKRRKEIRETAETEMFSELQKSDKEKQHMNDSNDGRFIETSVKEDLSKKSRKWKRCKFDADHSDNIALRESLPESSEHGDHTNGHHAIASVCCQVAADSCLVENVDRNVGSLGHRAVKMKSGSVMISNVASCEVNHVGSTDETWIEEVGTEVAVNKAHEGVSGIKPCLTETQKSKKRTRRSKKHRKTNHGSATVSNDAFLNSASKKADFVLTNISDDVSERSKVTALIGRTVASADSVQGAFANSRHIIFDYEDDGNVTNEGSDSINAQIKSSSVIKNGSGRLTEAAGREQSADSNGLSGHNGECGGLPVAAGEAVSMETEIFHDAEFLAARHLSGSVADESNRQQLRLPLNRVVLPGVDACVFSKPDVRNFGSSSQMLDDNAGRHKPRRTVTSDASPFANVQVFSRRRRKRHPATAELSSAAVESSPIHSSRLPKENGPMATEVTDYSAFNLLLGPPRAGDHIVYKILQLGADYSPGLSNYKEAEVLSYSPDTRTVHLKSLNPPPPSDLRKSLGRFDLTVEDENEILTNLATNNEQAISVLLDLLIEPRLLK